MDPAACNVRTEQQIVRVPFRQILFRLRHYPLSLRVLTPLPRFTRSFPLEKTRNALAFFERLNEYVVRNKPPHGLGEGNKGGPKLGAKVCAKEPQVTRLIVEIKLRFKVRCELISLDDK